MAGRKRSVGFLAKLKLLDWVIIVILLLAALILYKFVSHETRWVKVKAIAYSTVFQTNILTKGDYEVDSSGKKIAVVKNFEFTDIPNIPASPLHNKVVILDLEVLADTNSRSGVIQYKNLPLTVGSQIDFNFNSAQFQTYISETPGTSFRKFEEMHTLTVILYNQWPWFADSLNEGDVSKDASGENDIEVISKEVNPTQVVNTTATGEVMELIGSSKVDITLKLKVKLSKVNNSYLFQDYSNILVGKVVSFSLGKTQINNALVTNIE